MVNDVESDNIYVDLDVLNCCALLTSVADCALTVQGILAGSLCGWSQEGGLIPVNKNLWYGSL